MPHTGGLDKPNRRYAPALRAAVWFVIALWPPATGIAQEGGVPAVVDGREVVRIYGSLGPFAPKDRAPMIEQRIIALAEKGFSGGVTTREIPAENITAVVAGSVVVASATDVDAQAAGMSRQALAKYWAASVQTAIAAYRVRHSWTNLLVGLIKAMTAWMLFTASVWLLWTVYGLLSTGLERWFSRHVATTDVREFQLTVRERVKRGALALVKALIAVAVLCELSFLISYTLGVFPQTSGISVTLLDYLTSVLGSIGLAIVEYLPSGGVVIVLAVLTLYTVRVLHFLAHAVERGDLPIKGFHPEMARPTYQLARFIVILFAVVVAFPYLPGGKSDALKGVSIFLGLLLSLGSSSAVSNILAGLVLTYMRPYRAGDRVKIADTVGDVIEKRLLVTRVRTIKNIEVVIPNSAILGNQILNYSALAASRGLILNTTVTIGYNARWREVHELLIRAALNTSGIISTPPPFVLQTSLNDFHISYELNAYTDRPNEIQDIYSRLHEAIQDSFNDAGVEIMSPSFYALRDGNAITIPADQQAADYEPPSFRVLHTHGRPHLTGAPSAARGHGAS